MPGALRPFGHPDGFAADARKGAQLAIAVVPVSAGLVPVVVHAPDADLVQKAGLLAQPAADVPGARNGTRAEWVGEDVDRPRLQASVRRDQGVEAGGTIRKRLGEHAQVAKVHAVLGVRPIRLVKEPDIVHGDATALSKLQIRKDIARELPAVVIAFLERALPARGVVGLHPGRRRVQACIDLQLWIALEGLFDDPERALQRAKVKLGQVQRTPVAALLFLQIIGRISTWRNEVWTSRKQQSERSATAVMSNW